MSFDLTLGCFFIGMILNVWLFGFTCMHTSIYFSHFKKDVTLIKSAVVLLSFLNAGNTVLTIQFVYDYLVKHFGSVEYVSQASNSFAALSTTTSSVAYFIQILSAWRVWRMRSHNSKIDSIIPIVIVSISTLSFGCAIWTTVSVTKIRFFANFLSFRNAVSIWLGAAALADVIITATLIVKLRKAIGKGFDNIDSILGKLIKTTLQTGLLTTLFAVVDLILYLSSTTTIDMVFNFPLANLYMISLLSTLNARIVLRTGDINHTGDRSVGNHNTPSYMERGLPPPKASKVANVDIKDDHLETTPVSCVDKEEFFS